MKFNFLDMDEVFTELRHRVTLLAITDDELYDSFSSLRAELPNDDFVNLRIVADTFFYNVPFPEIHLPGYLYEV